MSNRTPISPTVDVTRAYWESRTSSGHRRSSEDWFQRYATELRTLLPAGGVLIDAGCGACELIPYLSPFYDVVHAFDNSSSMLDAADRRLRAFGLRNIELHLGSVEAFPATIQRADAIVTNQVIQYLTIEGIAKHLNECARVLKEGGKVLLGMIPNRRLKLLYQVGCLRGEVPRGLALLIRYVRTIRSRMKANFRGDYLWDGIGRWYLQEEIQRFAETAGFNSDIRNAWYYEYRFHAILDRRTQKQG
jgi:ubiquinone/menaquinone biosynthesis C-methylase UbiE